MPPALSSGSRLAVVYILDRADGSHAVGVSTDLHLHRHPPAGLKYLEGPMLAQAATFREEQIARWPAEQKRALIARTNRRCARLRAQILAFGPATDAIGGPPDASLPYSAQQLSAMLSFLRFDELADDLGPHP